MCLYDSLYSVSQPSQGSITMTRSESYLTLKPWNSGHFKFNFKTHQTHAVLLYHSSHQQEEDGGLAGQGGVAGSVFYIKIISGKS